MFLQAHKIYLWRGVIILLYHRLPIIVYQTGSEVLQLYLLSELCIPSVDITCRAKCHNWELF